MPNIAQIKMQTLKNSHSGATPVRIGSREQTDVKQMV
jgi:hypothetical protein